MESVEKTGETIEAAIDAGLKELGVTAADVMIEVLQEPYRGLMGIGAKPARVRIIFMGRRPEPPVERVEPAQPVAREPRSERAPRTAGELRGERPPRTDNRGARGAGGQRTDTRPPRSASSGTDTPRSTDRPTEATRSDQRGPRRDNRQPRISSYIDDFDVEFQDPDTLDLSPKAQIIPDDQADEMAVVGKKLLHELLEKMDILATVTIHKSESTREGEETLWILNISGEDTQPLIGRQGSTLSSLQYILRLMLSRQVQKRANIIVDVMEYKLRRNDRLRHMALKLADQAVKQGRTITLDPMPPNERRVIHLTLKERNDVETKSVGEGPGRKVTIHPVGS